MNRHSDRSVGIRCCCIDVYSQCDSAVRCDLKFMDYFSPASMTLQKSAMLLISRRNLIVTLFVSCSCLYLFSVSTVVCSH